MVLRPLTSSGRFFIQAGMPVFVAVVDLPRFDETKGPLFAALRPYLTAILLRGKEAAPRQLMRVGQAIQNWAPGLPLIVNDRLDVALALSAQGWHLPALSLDAAVVRPFWPGSVSASVHNEEELRRHQQADWLMWGHLFLTRSKPEIPARHWTGLVQVRRQYSGPLVGIGGITADNVSQLRPLHLQGVAVADGIWQATNPLAAVKAISKEVRRWSADWKGDRDAAGD